MESLELRLIRTKKTIYYTEGVLINLNNNHVLFEILEDRVRDINMDGDLDDIGEGKVMHETAIPFTPKGKPYQLEVTYSPKFKMDMVLIKDVPHFTGIRMHWGRTAKQSSGCPLGGEKVGDGELKNIGYTKAMVDLLNEYGGKATLEIV